MGKGPSKSVRCSVLETEEAPFSRMPSYSVLSCQFEQGRLSMGQDSIMSMPTGSHSNEDLRNRLLQRISSERISRSESQSKGQSMIVFDWDNTLLCTSYLSSKQNDEGGLDMKTIYRLSLIERMALRLLKFSISLGKTYIVTNASKEWVEYSAKIWAPKLLEVFDQLTIISARTEAKGEFRYLWKKKTFLKIKEMYDTEKIINLVSIGDSTFEREAARLFGQFFPHRCIKTIKFQRMPSPRDLYKQLTIVNDRLQEIFDSGKSLTINLRPKFKEYF